MPDTEYDITTLQEGTVDSILEKLGALSLPQLKSLLQLEQEKRGDKARSTLTDPLNEEIAKREAAGEGAGAPGDATTGSASAPATGDARSQPSADDAVRSYSQDELDAIVAEKEREWAAERDALKADRDALASEVESLNDEKLMAEHHAGVRDEAAAAASRAAAAPLQLTDGIDYDWLADVTKHGGYVVFVDEHDRPLPQTYLSMMPAAGSAFESISGSLILLSDIEFPTHGVQTEIAGAFLLLDDERSLIAKAELAPAVRVGGGTPHKLPGRSLYFSRPAG